MQKLEITLLPGTEDYAADIQLFADLMVHKLMKNRHKGHWEGVPLATALERFDKEVAELREALASGSTAWTLEEAADVANSALILASIRLRAARNENKTDPMGRAINDAYRSAVAQAGPDWRATFSDRTKP